MAAADFCTVTPDVAAERAVASMVIAADSSLAAGSSPRRLVLVTRCDPIRDCHHPHAPHAVQISPGRCANCRCVSGVGAPSPISTAFTVGCVPMGFAVMCQLASHPSALYAV